MSTVLLVSSVDVRLVIERLPFVLIESKASLLPVRDDAVPEVNRERAPLLLRVDGVRPVLIGLLTGKS